MKKNLLMLFMLLSICGYTQNVDVINKQFTLSLINEGLLTIEDIEKNKLYYDVDLIQLELDSIGNYFEDIYFYKFTLGENKIIYNKNIKVSLSVSSCEEFILGFSSDAVAKYRLKGFSGNDLLFLLRDIKITTGYKKSYNEILSNLNLFINDINFEEVYEAIINLDFDSPSLKNCKDGKKAHGKIKQ